MEAEETVPMQRYLVCWSNPQGGISMRRARFSLFFVLALTCPSLWADDRLPGTAPLTVPPDLIAAHLKQAQGYFLRQIEAARTARDRMWKPDFSSPEAYEKSLAPHRARLRTMLGLGETNPTIGPAKVEVVAESPTCRISRVAIPMSLGLTARGLLIQPTTPGRHPVVVACYDADTWPEEGAGLGRNTEPAEGLHDLIARGATVYVPQSIERLKDHPYCETTKGKDRRMILYRLGYVVGRTMPGLDVQDTIAVIDYLAGRPDVDPARVCIGGLGQGGMTAFYAAAVDRRARTALVEHYFGQRERCWAEPVDRRLPGQLLEFGDAEVAALVAPRSLGIITQEHEPAERQAIAGEIRRAERFFAGLKGARLTHIDGTFYEVALSRVIAVLGLPDTKTSVVWPEKRVPDAQARAIRDAHFEERLRYLRGLIAASEEKRQKRWGLTTRPAAEFPQIKAAMLADYRKLVGEVSTEGTPLRPRSQWALTTAKYTAYRVMLDVAPGVEVYGNLLLPHGLKGPAPAVICQHGLTGTPEMITGLGQKEDTPYHEFGRKLAERGYVIFAPLIMHYHPVEWTNDQVRQADAVGMMRVSLAIAQTQRVVDFLQTLPSVDPKRIGYYGLSYGGYSTLWVSPLVDRVSPIVVSGHFNDWRSKITSDATPTSYLRHPDEDFYNWDVLHRFTHPELIAMMAPRAVCIEFGRRDGITTPEWTAYAWKQLAAIRDHLGLKDRIRLAEFDGVHEVHGVEAFAFVDEFLGPPRP
jgi:dienelactone hydrolase